uniref:Transmembrane protein 144 n=1 Tax=Haemonchus contortus TaxID=6289 RepID=A0A7I4YXD8_HAECO|nr:Protein of unknown function DUF1632 domain containing protein [Haemonchus contortus]
MAFLVGIIACIVAGLFFGSMFVALRRVETGDGIFAQWVMSVSILCVGFGDFWYQGFPGFYPFAMLGGAFWTVGNSTAIPLIKRIGLALGLLIWGSAKCVVGWATGRFGLLGMNPNPPASDILNYAGVVFVILGGIAFSMVRVERNIPETQSLRSGKSKDADEALRGTERISEASSDESSTVSGAERSPPLSARTSTSRGAVIGTLEKAICIAVSVLAGVCYGLNFMPVIYMIDNRDKYPDYPVDGLSYVFSHFFGIFLSATAIFLGYTIFRKGEPFMTPQLILPSFFAGLLWATAETAFFIANQHLSQAISFPIITGLPGCVASLWSVLYFHEIKGKRNLMNFVAALTLSIIGAVLVGLSKEVHL